MLFTTRLLRIRENESQKWIALRSFLFIGLALFSVAPSAYLSHLGLEDNYIGFTFSAVSFLVIIASIFLTYPLEKNNQIKVYTYAVFILFLSLVGMALWPYVFVFIALYTALRFTSIIRNGVENIQFRDVTPEKEYTRLRSLLQGLSNISWIIMPAIGGVLLANFGFEMFFLVIAYVFAITLFLSFYLKPHDIGKVRKQYDKNIKENLAYFLKQKQLLLAFALNFGKSLWYVFLFIYLPLYLLKTGYSLTEVGYAITATQIPLVFVQTKISPIIQRVGFQKLFVLSFFILAILALFLYFTQNIFLILFFLLISGICIGYLEVLPEIYYFKQVNKLEEEKTYFLFNSSETISTIIGGLVFGSLLTILTINQLFLVVAFLLFVFAIVATRTNDYRE